MTSRKILRPVTKKMHRQPSCHLVSDHTLISLSIIQIVKCKQNLENNKNKYHPKHQDLGVMKIIEKLFR